TGGIEQGHDFVVSQAVDLPKVLAGCVFAVGGFGGCHALDPDVLQRMHEHHTPCQWQLVIERFHRLRKTRLAASVDAQIAPPACARGARECDSQNDNCELQHLTPPSQRSGSVSSIALWPVRRPAVALLHTLRHAFGSAAPPARGPALVRGPRRAYG